jgi:hypothetical protein
VLAGERSSVQFLRGLIDLFNAFDGSFNCRDLALTYTRLPDNPALARHMTARLAIVDDWQLKAKPNEKTYILGADYIRRIGDLAIDAGFRGPSDFLPRVIDVFYDVNGPFDLQSCQIQSR